MKTKELFQNIDGLIMNDDFDPNSVSPTFCTLPFQHVSMSVKGQYKLCCMADESGASLYKMSVKDWWNSDELNEVRENMLNGKPVNACNKCYSEEKKGIPSKRQRFWPHLRGVNLGDNKILSLDFRPHNICNLRCATCGPSSSSAIAKEMKWQNYQFDRSAMFHDYISGLKHLYMAGGEPFLAPDFELILGKVFEHAKLEINTNLTVCKDAHLKALSKFHDLRIIASCDGTDEYFKLLRYPFEFSKFKENLLKMKQALPKALFSINVTISALNFLNLKDLLEELISIQQEHIPNLHANFNGVFLPKHLAIGVIPNEKRIPLAEQMLPLLPEFQKLAPKFNITEELTPILKAASRREQASDELRAELKRDILWLRENRRVALFPEMSI